VAVFTPVPADAADAFLTAYDLGRLVALEPVPEGVENTTYRLTAEAGVFALALFEARTAPDAPGFFLPLAAHAAATGVSVPEPIARRDGGYVGKLQARPAALVRWAPGAWSRAPTAPLTRRAGRALAELHLACRGFPASRANPMGREACLRLVERCAARAEGADAALVRELATEAAALGDVFSGDLPGGPIHADYFPDNVLFYEGEVSAVIDWAFACIGPWAYDLAVALTAWGFDEAGAADTERLQALRHGYEAVRPLQPAETAALPRLCRQAALRFTLSRLHDRLHHDAGWQVTPKDPLAYARRLRFFQDRREDAVA
jgi:homoserine kinase type II